MLVLAIGAFSVWLIVVVIFRFADNRFPWIVAAALTYIMRPMWCCRAPCA